MLTRYLKTSEVVVSKLFPAGCGWQAASIVADNLNYLPSICLSFYCRLRRRISSWCRSSDILYY